jgi:hypothetical protein
LRLNEDNIPVTKHCLSYRTYPAHLRAPDKASFTDFTSAGKQLPLSTHFFQVFAAQTKQLQSKPLSFLNDESIDSAILSIRHQQTTVQLEYDQMFNDPLYLRRVPSSTPTCHWLLWTLYCGYNI